MKGKVYLVGAGPGDPELLTLKALRTLKTADIVLHDELISPEILALIPKTAQLRGVGKRGGRKNVRQEEINALLVQFALLGMQVVRLKGGDPLIFGRAGEEMEAVRKAGIEVEVIPGVTAALAAAAATQIPLTHRETSSSLLILTGHHSDADLYEWPEQISAKATVVMYMPGYRYESTAQRLIAAGLKSTTPCAVISQATSAEQKVFCTTIEGLHQAPHLAAPTLLVVGEVVRYSGNAFLQAQGAWPAQSKDELAALPQNESAAQPGPQEQSE